MPLGIFVTNLYYSIVTFDIKDYILYHEVLKSTWYDLLITNNWSLCMLAKQTMNDLPHR